MVLVNSYGQVALAVNTVSAEEVLGLEPGDLVELRRVSRAASRGRAAVLPPPRRVASRKKVAPPPVTGIIPPRAFKEFSREDLRCQARDNEKNWYVVDAAGQTLGRLSTVVADALRGKRKPITRPTSTPATSSSSSTPRRSRDRQQARRQDVLAPFRLSGRHKGEARKDLLDRRPEEVVSRAVKGMLPHNTLGAARCASSRSTPVPSTRTRPSTRTARDQGVSAWPQSPTRHRQAQDQGRARPPHPRHRPRDRQRQGARRVLRPPRAATSPSCPSRRPTPQASSTSASSARRRLAGQAGAMRHGIAAGARRGRRVPAHALKRAGFLRVTRAWSSARSTA